MTKNDITNLVRVQRERVEEQARKAKYDRVRKTDRILQRRKRTYLNAMEKKLVEAAKRGDTSVQLFYSQILDDVVWWWEKRFLKTLDHEIEQALRSSLQILIAEHFKEFNIDFSKDYWRVTIDWK